MLFTFITITIRMPKNKNLKMLLLEDEERSALFILYLSIWHQFLLNGLDNTLNFFLKKFNIFKHLKGRTEVYQSTTEIFSEWEKFWIIFFPHLHVLLVSKCPMHKNFFFKKHKLNLIFKFLIKPSNMIFKCKIINILEFLNLHSKVMTS